MNERAALEDFSFFFLLMTLAFVNVHEIHTYFISFYWEFSHLLQEITRNILSYTF